MHLAVDMKTLNFQIVPLATEVAEAARRTAAAGAPDHGVVIADRQTGFRAGIVCAGRNPVSASFSSPTQQFRPVIHIQRAGRSSFTPNLAHATARRVNIHPPFAEAASSALTMQITT